MSNTDAEQKPLQNLDAEAAVDVMIFGLEAQPQDTNTNIAAVHQADNFERVLVDSGAGINGCRMDYAIDVFIKPPDTNRNI